MGGKSPEMSSLGMRPGCEWPLQWDRGGWDPCTRMLAALVGSRESQEHHSVTVPFLSGNRWQRCMLCPGACMMDLCLT